MMAVAANKDTTSFRNLWKKIKSNNNKSIPQNNKKGQNLVNDQVFGVPLKESLNCARATIFYADNNVEYSAFIPVIVAKCGSILKDDGLYTEGVFRISSSAKRMGELEQIFNSGPDYGQRLDWKGYSIHDAANILRRYLCYMPEPVIVSSLYTHFRDVMYLADTTEEEVVVMYQCLIEQLPSDHQYLLFYLLDLLHVFSQHAHVTKMDTANLAAVFTPGILLNPDHDMDPAHYKTSQKVLQFLIEHQDRFTLPRANVVVYLDNHGQNNVPSSPSTETVPEHQQRHNSQPNTSILVEPSSHSLLSNHQDQKIKRAKTMPTRRSRYGLNDPLQVVHMNKTTLEKTS